MVSYQNVPLFQVITCLKEHVVISQSICFQDFIDVNVARSILPDASFGYGLKLWDVCIADLWSFEGSLDVFSSRYRGYDAVGRFGFEF